MVNSDKVSALAPVSTEYGEEEKSSSWLGRQAAQSLTGRVVMSTYESLKTAGTVVCLSPWGDSSPLVMPSVRFRDLLIESVMAATGGTAAVAAPALEPLSDAVAGSLGDTVVAQLVADAGTELITGYADDKLIEGPLEDAMPDYAVPSIQDGGAHAKTVLISLKYKHTTTDAALGFYRSSVHPDSTPGSLFSGVKDYLGTQKGWFSPYLFASGRRPVIPRAIVPDVVFCHGPFLSGDYKVGQALLAETARVVSFAEGWTVPPSAAERNAAGEQEPGVGSKIMGGVRKWQGKGDEDQDDDGAGTDGTESDEETMAGMSKEEKKAAKERKKARKKEQKAAAKGAKARAKAEAKEEAKAERKADAAAQQDAQAPVPPTPRHIAVFALGLKPHRGKMWTSSQRPSESVMRYQLLSATPALLVPAKVGAPLLAWDAHTLAEPGKLQLDALYEFLDMCVDWERVKGEKKMVREVLGHIVEGAARESRMLGKQVDLERAGIVFWRVP